MVAGEQANGCARRKTASSHGSPPSGFRAAGHGRDTARGTPSPRKQNGGSSPKAKWNPKRAQGQAAGSEGTFARIAGKPTIPGSHPPQDTHLQHESCRSPVACNRPARLLPTPVPRRAQPARNRGSGRAPGLPEREGGLPAGRCSKEPDDSPGLQVGGGDPPRSVAPIQSSTGGL